MGLENMESMRPAAWHAYMLLSKLTGRIEAGMQAVTQSSCPTFTQSSRLGPEARKQRVS